jgi:UDP-glucose 4-epimerase
VVSRDGIDAVKILVTGGAGFIGSHVVDVFVAAGHAVAVLDDLSTGKPARVNREARLHVMDLRSDQLPRVFESEKPEVVAHLAAQAAVRRSVSDPISDAGVNIMGSLNLLDCCRRFGVGRIIYSSSGGAGYGDTDVLPTPEDHPPQPASPYGITKIAIEMYLRAWGPLFGIRGISLRYANVYGPRQDPDGEAGVVAIFCDRLLTGTPPIINGDGEQTRDYVYVEDVAAANLHAVEHPEVVGGVNIGTGIETSVNELYRGLAHIAGLEVAPEHGPAKPGEQRRSCLDPALAKRCLGWVPRVSLRDGLARTMAFFERERRRA